VATAATWVFELVVDAGDDHTSPETEQTAVAVLEVVSAEAEEGVPGLSSGAARVSMAMI
jgi:hypothetical protein